MYLLRDSQERFRGRMPENAHVFDRGAREAILGVSEGITGLLIHATGRTGK